MPHIRVFTEVNVCSIPWVAVNSVWVYSSILSSRGVRPFCILTAPDDYILLFSLLSLALSPRLFSPAFIPPSAGTRRNPIRENLKRSPAPPFPLSRCWGFFLLFFSASASSSFPACRCPCAGETGRIPPQETDIPGKSPAKPTKKIHWTLLVIGYSKNSQ